MNQPDLFIKAGENHLVIADHGAAAQRRNADIAAAPCAGDAVAAALFDILKHDLAALRRRRAEQKRRAGWRVDLVAVMHIKDFNIPIQCAGRLSHQAGQQINAEAHIARFDNTGMARCRFDIGFFFGAEACRADNMGNARLCCQSGQCHRYFGGGKVDHRICIF